MRFWRVLCVVIVCSGVCVSAQGQHVGGYVHYASNGSVVQPTTLQTVARRWMDVLLEAIRDDLARPTVHARNLHHTSIAMHDAWAAYGNGLQQVLHNESASASDVVAARREAMSHAAYWVLMHRFAESPGSAESLPRFRQLMIDLGYDPDFDDTNGSTPAALGNRVAEAVILFGLSDGSSETSNYASFGYEPVNTPTPPADPSVVGVNDPNRWQPLAIAFYVDQSGNLVPNGSIDFLSPEWGNVTPFSLDPDNSVTFTRDGVAFKVFEDPGPPPLLGTPSADGYRDGFAMVAVWSSHLDPADGVMWDVSPQSKGNAPLATAAQTGQFYDYDNGGDWGTGYALNPVTGAPYATAVVPRGDYARVVAEYWADGPDSETPPGHWITLLHYVFDHPEFERRWRGVGPLIDPLEWDVKSYLTMTGAMHDAAIAAWSVKGWYDYVRPITALRYMASLGQSTLPGLASYHPDGVPLIPGVIELVTPSTTAAGARHAHLAGAEGEIAFRAWRGPDFVSDPLDDTAGVGWILAEQWWPYQRPSFVTPPFAGYVSGHSTFSRAGAVVLDQLTGTPFFPGGLGEFLCPQNQFLVFEDGPSVDVPLRWATYYDAADESALSRIWGGIHPSADDLPGRQMGETIGHAAFAFAEAFFAGTATPNNPGPATSDQLFRRKHALGPGGTGLSAYVPARGLATGIATADYDDDGDIDIFVPQGHGAADRLFQNQGDGTFVDIAASAGLASSENNRAALFFDADSDGLLDLVVSRDASGFENVPSEGVGLRLYKQGPTGVFTEVTNSVGLGASTAPPGAEQETVAGGISAGDIDDDGDLDLFVAMWEAQSILFRNNGDGTFSDVTASSGIASQYATGWQGVFVDLNGDARLDVVTAVDFAPNEAFINSGDGTFTESAAAIGLDSAFNEMGIAVSDPDNDGDFDIYMTNMEGLDNGSVPEHNVFFRNESSGASVAFVESAIENGTWDGGIGWGATFIDFDHDGLLDLAASNTIEPGGDFPRRPTRLYRNLGTSPMTFEDVAPGNGFAHFGDATSLAAADFDRDGDLDLVQPVMDAGSIYYYDATQRQSATPIPWVVIKPRMPGTNRFAIGAVVRLTTTAGTTMTRLVTAGNSFAGQEPAEAFFALGGADAEVERVEVAWPGGITSTHLGIVSDAVTTIVSPWPAGSATYDVNGDGSIDAEDLYHALRSPTDINLDGDLDDLDDAALRAFLRRLELRDTLVRPGEN